VQLGIQGVPAHLWLRSTAQEILGSSCPLLSMAPETESKVSLKKFFVTVTCLHPDLIPNEKVMWAPIPFDARHPQPGFHYRAVIDILEVVVVSSGAPPPPPSSDFYQSGGAAEGPHLPPSGSGGASSSLSRPSGGVTPSASFRGGFATSGAGPWTAQAGSAPCLVPRWILHCPRRAPTPIRNGGYRASTCRQTSSAACRAPRRSAMPLAPLPAGRRCGVGRPMSRPLRLLGHPPHTLLDGLPLALRQWMFTPGSGRSRLSLSVLPVTLSLLGRLLLRAGRALQGWTYRSSPSVWGLPHWSVQWGRHPLCLYLLSWPLLSSQSS
jgi:hypothetical protein